MYRTGAIREEILMVSRGGTDKNLEKRRAHNIPFPVLVQERWEVSRKYEAFVVPVAFALDKSGRIKRGPQVGSEAILAMLR
jgi:hypothetical protein